jgi:hypothetical protein
MNQESNDTERRLRKNEMVREQASLLLWMGLTLLAVLLASYYFGVAGGFTAILAAFAICPLR